MFGFRFPKENQKGKVSSLEVKKRKALQRQQNMLNKMKKNQELFSGNIEEDLSDEEAEEPEISCCLCKNELEDSTLGPVSFLSNGFSPIVIPLKEEFQVFPIPSQYSVQIHSCFHYLQYFFFFSYSFSFHFFIFFFLIF